MTSREGLAPAAALFHSLADPVRLSIVQRLACGEARVVDLTRELGLAQSTVSKHLACLRGCRLVDYRAEGRQSFYFIAAPELLELLRSAERLLVATGQAVALCPTYGVDARQATERTAPAAQTTASAAAGVVGAAGAAAS